MKKNVWLRSSWEYIYAKWLDSKNILWDIECQMYNVKYLDDNNLEIWTKLTNENGDIVETTYLKYKDEIYDPESYSLNSVGEKTHRRSELSTMNIIKRLEIKLKEKINK